MIPDHPVITYMQRDGYLPSWYHCPDKEPERCDEDWEYDARREAELFGQD